MAPVFHGEWSSLEDLKRDFRITDEALKGVSILFAGYDCPSYEGYAFVVFKKNRKLFEVNASHCSCYGLEDQWQPEPTTRKYLQHLIDNNSWGVRSFASELAAVLAALKGGRK